MSVRPLRIIPLGGLGEIGKNMLVLEDRDDLVIIDAGVQFADEDMPGVDLIIPDISYLLQRQKKIRAILITHGHEDHIGALPYILRDLNVPVYAPRLAHGLIGLRLKEHSSIKNRQIIPIEPGKRYRFGKLSAEWFRVCHSIPDAMGIGIYTSHGLVVHTGDFKIDHTPVDGRTTDFSALARFAEKGVFLLLSDSTYAELPGYTPSEKVVGGSLDTVIGQATGRVMVATFASLIARVQQVVAAAQNHGRRVAVVGRSMVDNINMAQKLGYLTGASDIVIPYRDLKRLPPEQAVIVMTGSQGEPTSALVRISNQDHREIKVVPGDTVVISATPIPGNETAVARSIDNLFRQGASVIDHHTALVHVHGHASQEELKTVLNLVRPKFFVPVHGQYRHLVRHVELACSVGIPPQRAFLLEDGDVLELTAEGGMRRGRVPAGPRYVDGLDLWSIGSTVLRERRQLSRDGLVVVVLTIDERTGILRRKPFVLSNGFLEGGNEAQALLDTAAAVLISQLQESLGIDLVERGPSKIVDLLGNYLNKRTGRRPMIIPVVLKN